MKTIIHRKRAAMTVVTASREWAPPTAAGLAEFLGPELEEGETMPDWELVQKLFGRALARRWERLDAADQAHVAAAARHRASLAERDAATRTLYRGVVDLRTLMRGIFGARPARRLLGIKGRTSLDPVVLERQARYVVARLRDRCRKRPSSPPRAIGDAGPRRSMRCPGIWRRRAPGRRSPPKSSKARLPSGGAPSPTTTPLSPGSPVGWRAPIGPPAATPEPRPSGRRDGGRACC